MAYIQFKEGSSIDSPDITNTEKYMKYSIDPHLTNYAQDIEYFYIESDFCDLEKFKENYKLSFISNEEFDETIHSLQEMKYSNRDSCLYTVQTKYSCPQNKYLINYQLQLIDQKDKLNQWQIHWKKICTETKIPRNGLNIDLELGSSDSRISLVKNGVTISEDPLELDKSADTAKFIVYLSDEKEEQALNAEEGTDGNNTFVEEEAIEAAENEDQQLQNAEKKGNLQVLKNMVLQINEEIIQKPVIYFNEQELKININGNLGQGGSISRQGDFDQSIRDDDTILLELNCLQSGNSEFQLLIPLVHFEDIKLKISKKCGVNIKEEFIQFERKIGLELFFLIFFFLFTLTHFIYTVMLKNQNVIQSYPFLLSVVHFLLARQFIKKNQRWYEFLLNLTQQQNNSMIDKQVLTVDETAPLNINSIPSYTNDNSPDIYDDESYKNIKRIEDNPIEDFNAEQTFTNKEQQEEEDPYQQQPLFLQQNDEDEEIDRLVEQYTYI